MNIASFRPGVGLSRHPGEFCFVVPSSTALNVPRIILAVAVLPLVLVSHSLHTVSRPVSDGREHLLAPILTWWIWHAGESHFLSESFRCAQRPAHPSSFMLCPRSPFPCFASASSASSTSRRSSFDNQDYSSAVTARRLTSSTTTAWPTAVSIGSLHTTAWVRGESRFAICFIALCAQRSAHPSILDDVSASTGLLHAASLRSCLKCRAAFTIGLGQFGLDASVAATF